MCTIVHKIRILGNRKITQNLNEIQRYLGSVSKIDTDDVFIAEIEIHSTTDIY